MLLNISYAKKPLLVICNVNLSKKCVCVFFLYTCVVLLHCSLPNSLGVLLFRKGNKKGNVL